MEREIMERWIVDMTTQHQKVLGMADDACTDAAQCYKDREVYHAFLERVNFWLQNKERATGKLCSMRLQALEVEKQMDKCKSLVAECQNYEPIIEQLKMKIDPLKDDSTPEMAAELNHKYSDIETRFGELINQLDELQRQLRDTLSIRKVYEGDMQRVNRWCEEIEIKCPGELHLNCAVEVLEEQYKQYKNLSNTAMSFASLVTEITERGQTFLPSLYEADTFKLQQQLKSLKDRYDRVADVIEEHVQSLENALQTKGQVNSDVKEVNEWLISVQEDLRHISRTVGPSIKDAENIMKQLDETGEKFKKFQPIIAQLSKAVEQLRNSGQDMEAEDILRMTLQYEMLEDQVNQQRKTYGQAVTLRQQYYAQLSDFEVITKECEDEVVAVEQPSVCMPTRLDRYEDVLVKIGTAEAILVLMDDKAQQIMNEAMGDEANCVREELVVMKVCLDGLKKTVEQQVKQCEKIQKIRKHFESTIDDAIDWLEEKEGQLGMYGSLDLNPAKVSIVYQKYQTLSRDTLDKLETLKGKADKEHSELVELQEPIPLLLTEKLERLQLLEDSIKGSITQNEQYLASAKADRLQLDVSLKQISDWLSGAEVLLDSGYEGLDYDTLTDTLSEHRDYFSGASMCQDEMEQVLDLSDRLVLTLDASDKETIYELLMNTEQKLANILSTSQRKQDLMVEKSSKWQEFEVAISQMMEMICRLEQDWNHVISIRLVNPAKIQQQTEHVKEFINNLEKIRPQISELNEKNQYLEKLDSTSSQRTINRGMSGVNDRWAELVASTKTKQISLQELSSQWEQYGCLFHAVKIVLNEAEAISPLLDKELATCQQLIAEIEAYKELHDKLECTQPKMSALKKCGQNLQKSLPTAEAKVQFQEELMGLLEKFQRSQDKTREHRASLHEEVDERERFSTEAEQTIEWLKEMLIELRKIEPGLNTADVIDRLEKQKLKEQDIAVRMEQMRRLIQAQETKYTFKGKVLPQELQKTLAYMNELERDVASALASRQEELEHRIEFNNFLQLVLTWLGDAESKIQERIVNIPDCQARHEELLAEFNYFKKDLDNLRTKGTEIIQQSPDPQEKQLVQKTLKDINRHWLATQAQLVEKTKHLNEADQLSKSFASMSEAVESWITQAEQILDSEPTSADFDTVRDQLKKHQRLADETEQYQDNLGHMTSVVQQMEQVCVASLAVEKMTLLSQHLFNIRTQTSDRVNSLSNTKQQMAEFEQEVSELRRWMDQTKTHLTMRDTALTVTDQVTVQEKLLKDIDGQRNKADMVLQKHADLRSTMGDASPSQEQNLTNEISNLRKLAEEQYNHLQIAAFQQEQYDTDIRQLSASIDDTQQKLMIVPPLASSVEAFKKQIADQNVSDSEPSLQESRDHIREQRLSSVQSPLLTDTSSDGLSERSSSWSSDNLQLDTKDQDLKAALQKQERYQQSVQSVTAKMEQVHSHLTGKVPETSLELDKKLKDYTEMLQNIETIKEDITVVKERGQQIGERPSPDGNKAMIATLSMLGDKLENLQSLTEDRGICLQDAVKKREKHQISLTAYQKKMKKLENWVDATKIEQAMVSMPTSNMEALKQQADKNKKLQDDLNLKLELISDLAVQCDSLCEMEPHGVASRLCSQLANAQGKLCDMKLAAIERHGPLRKALREGEKRNKKTEDHDQSVENMQKWINDTKKLTTNPEVVEPLNITEDRILLQQQLKADLLTHQESIQMLSTSTIGKREQLLQSETTNVLTQISEKDMHMKWCKFSKELSERTAHLQESIRSRPAREMLPPGYRSRSVIGQTLPRVENRNDIRLGLADLNDLWNQLQIHTEDRQLRLEQKMDFQQKYLDSFQGISFSLDSVECKLFSPDSDKETEFKLKENEDLQWEIKSLQDDISSISHFSQHLLTLVSVESRDLIRTSMENLNQHVALLKNGTQEQSKELLLLNRCHKQYQEEVVVLQSNLGEVKSLMSTTPAALNQLITHMQKIEALLKKCESQLEQLKEKSTELSALAPKILKLSDLNILQSSFMDLHRKAMNKRAELLQSVSELDQYEKLLEDYTEFLETSRSKLKSDTISAKDLPHLRHQLNMHKDFFGDLETHRAMLDSLASQCDKTMQEKHQSLHTRLSSLTYVIQDKASLQGQRLERLVQQWTELDEKLVRIQRFLRNVEQNVPGPMTKSDTLNSIQEKISVYRHLQRELAEEKPTVFLVVDKGKQLLHSIHCPTLEAAVAEVADKWVALNTGISQEFKRTESLGDQLQMFETESTVLRSWLTAAKSKLSGLKHLTESDLQSIGSIRVKVEKLLEFRKEIEAQAELRVKVMSVGHKLIHTKQYDTSDLDDQLKWIKEEWELLSHDVRKADKYFQQAQMDLMPSRQALTEINGWLDHIQNDLVSDKNKPLKSMADVEQLLKKYKEHKFELATKQLTVDFVNQSVQQTTGSETGSPIPAEKTDFAERLGQLNSRWEAVTTDVMEQLRKIERISSKWEEYENGLGHLQKWLSDQEDKVKLYRLSGHESALKQTLKDCKSLQHRVCKKMADINVIRKLGESLASVDQKISDCQQIVKGGLESIDTQWRNLNKQIVLSEEQLEKALSLWASYNTEFQSHVKLLTETEYNLNKSNLLAGDLAAIKIQKYKLETLMLDVDQNADKVDRFNSLTGQLIKMCQPPITQELQGTQVDVQNRYRTLQAELRVCSVKVSQCLQQWERYEADYIQARQWLDAKEQHCSHLIAMREEQEQKSDCLQQSKNLQRDLDQFQSRLATMYQLNDKLTSSLEDSITIANITSQQSGIEHRVLVLRQTLDSHMQHLKGNATLDELFQKAYDRIRDFLSVAEDMLGLRTQNRSANVAEIIKNLEEHQLLLMQFSLTLAELDKLNDLGYQLALNETMSKELQLLNHKWQDLHGETLERCKMLQGILLTHQNFTEKCKTWMLFLKQMEEDLATEIGGNLVDLTEQQTKCEKFDSEMHSRQQILHAIISDGQKMMAEGNVEDKEEFQQKLELLAEQWQSVVRRTNQRKTIIDNTIKNWHAFNDLRKELQDWLNDKEKILQSFKFDSCSLQQIKNLLEKTRNTQNEFKLQEDTFRRVHEQGKYLVPRADDTASEDVKVSMAQLQEHWYQLFGRLEEHCGRLEDILCQWQECEDNIEDILTWLKDTRKILHADFPTTYDELQSELQKCKDIERAFTNSGEKRENLLTKEKNLSAVIQPEDLNVLHQRIRLLNKQWNELCQQAVLRNQGIKNTLFKWSNFGNRVKQLCDWLDQTELRIINSKESHIEDMLEKLNKDFNEEITEKEKLKSELTEQGQRLMKDSSEIRASDIEHRLRKMEDKWQHLKAVISHRQRKLQETLLALQQLDKSMTDLCKWLSDVEQSLSTPLIFRQCQISDMQEKLCSQEDLQRDIEQHSVGVGSVLNLCEVLLHDSDACPMETDFNALQAAMKNLDRRWHNICQCSPKRRIRIKETQDICQAFTEDCRRFEDWSRDVEFELRQTSISSVPNKEEMKYYESLQKKIHENLSQLESINHQYRRLVHEGCTDSEGVLRAMMQEANDRWDRLQQLVASVMGQVKNTESTLQDFHKMHTTLYSWITEVDIQLTNMEHLSSMDISTKIKEMQRLNEKITKESKKLGYLDKNALFLMQHGDSEKTVKIQHELSDIKQYHRQVVDRAARCLQKLQRAYDAQFEDLEEPKVETPTMDELGLLEEQWHGDSKDDFPLSWDKHDTEAYLESPPPGNPPEKHRTSRQGALRQSRTKSSSRSRKRSRSSKKSSSPRRSFGKDAGLTREERWMRIREEISSEARWDVLLEKLFEALEDTADNLLQAEEVFRSMAPQLKHPSQNYAQYIMVCERSINNLRSIDRKLKTQIGLDSIPSADAEIKSVIKRWETVQAKATENDFCVKQQRHDYSQFHADLDGMLAWLDEAEALQSTHAPVPGDITQLDIIIRQHKDFLVQIDSKKARVLSINLTCKHFIQPDTLEGEPLNRKLNEMNHRWAAICNEMTQTQKELQDALMQSQEFHHTVHDLLVWLETMETKVQQSEPIKLSSDESAHWSKYRKLMDLKREMENTQPRIFSLKEMADQFLVSSESTEMTNAQDKMHIIANRLMSLMRLCSTYISSLEERLKLKDSLSQLQPPSMDDQSLQLSTPRSSRSSSSRYSPFSPGLLQITRTRSPFALSRQLFHGMIRPLFRRSAGAADDNSTGPHEAGSPRWRSAALMSRVCRKALPLQLLIFLLLGIASLVLMSNKEYCCDFVNNFRRSLAPMLRYTDGPPAI